MPTFQGQTNTESEFQLQSQILDAFWHTPIAYIQGIATLEVRTLYVSPGSPIQIHLNDRQGAPLETIQGKVHSNIFRKKVPIRGNHAGGIFFEAKLPDHGLTAIGPMLAVPGPMRLSRPQWFEAGTQNEVSRLRREMDVDVAVRVEGIPDGTDGRIVFLERLTDRKVHKIVSIPSKVMDGHLKLTWRFDYPRDTQVFSSQHEKRRTAEEYRAPRIFFEAHCQGAKVVGSQADFVDWIEICIRDRKGRPVPGQRVKATQADGSVQERQADESGIVRIEGVAPGNSRLELLPPLAIPVPESARKAQAPAQLVSDKVDERTESTAPPAPVPPPVALATPPKVKGPIRIWVNAFIPEEIRGYTRKIRKGEFAGKTAIPCPWQLRPEGFLLTDGRGFAETATAKSRFKTWVSLRFEGSLPVLDEQSAFCDPLQEIREIDADEGDKASAKPNGILWHGLTGSTDLIRISIDARARLPQLEDLPEIRFQGTFTLDLSAMTLAFEGKSTVFPAFEAYVRVRKGPVNHVLQELPAPGATPWDLREGMQRSFVLEAKELCL